MTTTEVSTQTDEPHYIEADLVIIYNDVKTMIEKKTNFTLINTAVRTAPVKIDYADLGIPSNISACHLQTIETAFQDLLKNLMYQTIVLTKDCWDNSYIYHDKYAGLIDTCPYPVVTQENLEKSLLNPNDSNFNELEYGYFSSCAGNRKCNRREITELIKDFLVNLLQVKITNHMNVEVQTERKVLQYRW